MKEETKRWMVEYSHADGRSGVVEVATVIGKSETAKYGNRMYGGLSIVSFGFQQSYDLRYCKEKDLHMVMLKDYFGRGLVKAIEI